MTMKDDQHYIDLFIQWRRLMSANARENHDRCDILAAELEALRDAGGVSQRVIDGAPYVPWR